MPTAPLLIQERQQSPHFSSAMSGTTRTLSVLPNKDMHFVNSTKVNRNHADLLLF